MAGEVWDEITYPVPNFNGCTVEVWEWIRNFIPHFVMDVITHPCRDLNGHVSKKGSQVTIHQWAGPSLQ